MKEQQETKFYKIFAGLGGGFGGAQYIETMETTFNDAEETARLEACETYDSYGGMHGLSNYEDALKENPDLSQEELDAMYIEDLESWIDYHVEEADSLNNEDEHL